MDHFCSTHGINSGVSMSDGNIITVLLTTSGTFMETLNGMEEINLREGGYDQSIFRMYAPDVKSFMHAKTIPNQVTVATGKLSHTGKSTFLPELEFMKSILPEDQWANIKLTLTSPSW